MKAAEAISWLVIRILYMAHLYGCTTVLYEGKPFGTPDAGAFFRLVHEYQVTVISTAPTAIRAIKREDPDGKRLANYDLSLLQSLFLAGERSDPDNINHFHELLEVPIRVLEGIVKMVGESMGRKLPDGKKVIVAIGMGDFNTTKSRHVMFIRGYLEHDERPAYLKPPPKDKNTASKRKVDEGGTSRGAKTLSGKVLRRTIREKSASGFYQKEDGNVLTNFSGPLLMA
ncbi:hypothetical protein SeLEV6574_g06237 [Synchytrium endobioticum]|uniref:AMP-dependent synthetase/ligase domain-containing protein n=1 Tax=Synchytrium endobioticum TaxID=286115 RepID=A0A507CPS1_9FUNG|nr:hypothetical protein SeLEV6574_g06237 [Synchytrium endobioticum]